VKRGGLLNVPQNTLHHHKESFKTYLAVSVFVDIVTQVYNVVNTILSNNISIRVEETLWVVTAGVYSNLDV